MTDFDEFVATHVDDLLRTAYLIVWDEAEAEDLVQECLLKVVRRCRRSAGCPRASVPCSFCAASTT
jgi:DNA-directed RNA polymerase specialized sigma24 family protein